MSKMVRILLVEDHKLIRQGFKLLMENLNGYQVVAEAEGVREAVEACRKKDVDLVLLDLFLGAESGVDAILPIKEQKRDVKVLIVSSYQRPDLVKAALGAGAEGYILKSSGPDELHRACRCVLSGKIYLCPEVAQVAVREMLEGGRSEREVESGLKDLSPREREVCRLVAEGKGNREVAEALSISPKTVEKHRDNIRKKLGLESSRSLSRHMRDLLSAGPDEQWDGRNN